jgi:hypothetical protein
MEPRIFRPPILAVWLVGFFVPEKRGEAIHGDLVEEFSKLASTSGLAAARRWYWRQSVGTVAHLMGSGFCAVPWLIAATVLGGCLALWFGLEWGDLTLFHLNINLRSHGVRIFWLPWGIQAERFLVMMLVGCLVALAVEGREMVTAIALSLVCAAMSGFVYPQWTIVHNAEYALPVRLFQFTASIAILFGAAIVREIRFVRARHHLSV